MSCLLKAREEQLMLAWSIQQPKPSSPSDDSDTAQQIATTRNQRPTVRPRIKILLHSYLVRLYTKLFYETKLLSL